MPVPGDGLCGFWSILCAFPHLAFAENLHYVQQDNRVTQFREVCRKSMFTSFSEWYLVDLDRTHPGFTSSLLEDSEKPSGISYSNTPCPKTVPEDEWKDAMGFLEWVRNSGPLPKSQGVDILAAFNRFLGRPYMAIVLAEDAASFAGTEAETILYFSGKAQLGHYEGLVPRKPCPTSRRVQLETAFSSTFRAMAKYRGDNEGYAALMRSIYSDQEYVPVAPKAATPPAPAKGAKSPITPPTPALTAKKWEKAERSPAGNTPTPPLQQTPENPKAPVPAPKDAKTVRNRTAIVLKKGRYVAEYDCRYKAEHPAFVKFLESTPITHGDDLQRYCHPFLRTVSNWHYIKALEAGLNTDRTLVDVASKYHTVGKWLQKVDKDYVLSRPRLQAIDRVYNARHRGLVTPKVNLTTQWAFKKKVSMDVSKAFLVMNDVCYYPSVFQGIARSTGEFQGVANLIIYPRTEGTFEYVGGEGHFTVHANGTVTSCPTGNPTKYEHPIPPFERSKPLLIARKKGNPVEFVPTSEIDIGGGAFFVSFHVGSLLDGDEPDPDSVWYDGRVPISVEKKEILQVDVIEAELSRSLHSYDPSDPDMRSLPEGFKRVTRSCEKKDELYAHLSTIVQHSDFFAS